ncbi:DUF4157 domain-containing protein [Sphingobium rhizovicinum]|uniref:DUF4157 domain-containing protein n=1 Tax=Sphingobium rhizovicinum TaxID=432308 RepID=A0ABV7NJY3_9SPHN
MKAAAEKSSTVSTAAASHVARQPFVKPVGQGGGFFPGVQAKMTVSEPGDRLEKEADHLADKVVRMPAPTAAKEAAQRKVDDRRHGIDLQRKADEKIAKAPAERPEVQRKTAASAPASGLGGGDVQSAIRSRTGGGEPLSSDVRAHMEPRFGADFSDVRIHRDSDAAQLNSQLSARAFTYQNHIFFSRGQYQPGTSSGQHLLAHELTHTIQQGHAIQRSPDVSVTAATPTVQRLGVQDALDKFAEWANAIPGFRMLTLVLGFNPVSMRSVDRNAANLLRALIEIVPGGSLISQALDNHGIINKAANWVEQKIAALGDIGGQIAAALWAFINSLSWTDIFDLGGVWDRAKAIFTGPIGRLIDFGVSTAVELLKIVKEAILEPLAALAEGTRGYDLLRVLLGADPITGEAVPRTAETLLGGFMKLIGQEEIWENIKKGNAILRAYAWFQTALEGLMGMVRTIPAQIIATFASLTFADVVSVAGAFTKIAGAFISAAGTFFGWGLTTIWNLLEIVFDVVKPGLMTYVRKTGAALKGILKNPLPFLGHLINAAKLGFNNFSGNILTHLKNGLLEWLTGALEGVYLPKALSLLELGKFALSVLGISWLRIRGKIVKALGSAGEKIMQGLELAFDVVKALVTGGVGAAWELIKEKLTDLKDQVVNGVIGFVTDTIVKKAIPKLISMFIPGAGFIPAILSIYDTIMVFVEKIAKIIQVVTAFIDSIVTIAAGNIAAAAKKVESVLGGLLSLSISFLAGFLGLGKITDKIKEVIEKVRVSVDKALDAAIAWVVAKAKALFARLFGKDDDKKDTEQSTKVKAAAAADIKASSRSLSDPADLEKMIDGVYNKHSKDGLKTIRVTPNKEGSASIVLNASADLIAEEVRFLFAATNPRKVIAKVTLNNSWVEPRTYQNVDGVHAEEVISQDWPNIISRFNAENKGATIKSIDIFVKYSPCKGVCAPKLLNIAAQHPGAKFSIYYGELYVGKKGKELENSVDAVNTMQGAGIKIAAFEISTTLSKIRRGR